MDADDLIMIVRKLTGKIHASGEEHIDCERLKNLDTIGRLVDVMLQDIHVAARSADRQEDSMRRIGLKAKEFLREYGVIDQ